MANWWEQDEAVASSDNWWDADPVVGEDKDDTNWIEGMWAGIVGQTASGVAGTTQATITQAEEYATQPYAHHRFGRSGIAAGLMGQRSYERDETLRPEVEFGTGFAESMRGLAEEKLETAAEGRPENYAGQVLYDAGTAVGVMLPSLAVGMATRNPNAALAMMGIPAFGSEYEDAMARGHSHERALVDAWVSVGAELGPEKMFGFWEKALGTKAFKDLIKVSLTEAGSEVTTESINMVYDALRGESEVEGLSDIAQHLVHSALVGAVMGGGLGVAPAVRSRQEQQLRERREQGIEWERERAAQASRDAAISGEAGPQIDPDQWTAEATFQTDWLGQPVQEVAPTRISGLEDEKTILDRIEEQTASINATIEQEPIGYQEQLELDELDQARLRRQRIREEMGDEYDPMRPAEKFEKQEEFQFTMPVDPQELGSPDRAPWQAPTAEEVEEGQLYRMRLEEIEAMDFIDLVREMPPHRQDQYFDEEDPLKAQQLVDNQREILIEEAAEQRAGRGVLRVSRQELYDARTEEEATRLEDDRQEANQWNYKAENRSWNNNIEIARQLGEQLSKEEFVSYHKRAGEKGKWEVLGLDPESMMVRVKWTQKRKQGDGEVEFTWKLGDPDSVHVVRTDAGVQSRVNSTKKKPPNELVHQLDKVGSALILTGGDAARFPSRGTDKGVKRDVPFIGAPRAKALVESIYQQLVADYRGSLAPKGRLVEGKESREKVDPKVLEELYEEAKRVAARNISSVEKAVRTGTFVGVDAPTLVQVPGQHTFEQDMGQVITLMEKGAKQRLNSGQTVLEKAYQVMVDGSIREIEITANEDGSGYEMTPIAQGLNRFTGKVPTEPFATGKPDKRWLNRQRDLGRGATVEDIINNEKIDRANKLKEMEEVHKRKLSQAQIEKRKETAPESAAEYARRREAQRTPEQKRKEELDAARKDEDAELFNLAREQEAELAAEEAKKKRATKTPEEEAVEEVRSKYGRTDEAALSEDLEAGETVSLADVQKAEEAAARERPVAAEDRTRGPGVDREADLGLEKRLTEARQDTFYNFKSTPRTVEESLARSELEKALDAITPYVDSITAPGSLTVPSAVGRLQRARVRRALMDVMKAVEAAGPQGTGQAKMILSAPLDMPRMWGNLVEAMKRVVEQDGTTTAEQKEILQEIIVETYAQTILDAHGREISAAETQAEKQKIAKKTLAALREIRALPNKYKSSSEMYEAVGIAEDNKFIDVEKIGPSGEVTKQRRRRVKGKPMPPDVFAATLIQDFGMNPVDALALVEEMFDQQLGQELLLKLEEQAKAAKAEDAKLRSERVTEAGLVQPTGTERAGFVPERGRGEIAGERRAGEPTQWDVDRPTIEIVQEDLRQAAIEASRATGVRRQLIDSGYERRRLTPGYETGEESRLRQREKAARIKQRKEERALREREEKVRQQEAENQQTEFERMRDREVAAEKERRRLNEQKIYPLPRIEMGTRFDEKVNSDYINDPQQLELELPEGKGPKKRDKKGDTKKRMQKTPQEWSMELSSKKKVLITPKTGINQYEVTLPEQFKINKKGEVYPVAPHKGARKKKGEYGGFWPKEWLGMGQQATQAEMKFDAMMEKSYSIDAVRDALDFQIRFGTKPSEMTGVSTDPDNKLLQETAERMIIGDYSDPLGRAVFKAAMAKTWLGRKVLRYGAGRQSSLVANQKTLMNEKQRLHGLVARALTAHEDAWAIFRTEMKGVYEVGNKQHERGVVAYLDDTSISEVEKEYGLRISDEAAQALDKVKSFRDWMARMGVEYGAFSTFENERVRAAIDTGHGYTTKSLRRRRNWLGGINKRLRNQEDLLYELADRAWNIPTSPDQVNRMTREELEDVFLDKRHNIYLRNVRLTDDGSVVYTHVTKKDQRMEIEFEKATDTKLKRSDLKFLSDADLRKVIHEGMPRAASPDGQKLETVITRMIGDITGIDVESRKGLLSQGADKGIMQRREFLLSDREYNRDHTGLLKSRANRLKIGPDFDGWIEANQKAIDGWSSNTFFDEVGKQFPQLKGLAEELRADVHLNKVLRDIVGEETDPEAIMGNTMRKLAETVGTSIFLADLVEQGMAYGWAKHPSSTDLNSKDWVPLAPVNSKFGKSTFLSPGYTKKSPWTASEVYVKPEVAEAIADMFRIHEVGDRTFHGLSKLSGFSKYMVVVASPLAHARNFFSTGTIHAARHLFGSNSWKAYKLAGSIFWRQARAGTSYTWRAKDLAKENPEASKLFNHMLSEGMLFDGGKSGAVFDVNNPDGIATLERSRGFGRAFGRVKYFTDNMFRLEDEGVKVAGFVMNASEYLEFVHNRKDLFDAWLNNKQLTAEEQKMVDDALFAAKENTLNRYPTFSRVAGGVKTVSRIPFFGSFPSFSYEVMRTSAHAAIMDGALAMGQVPDGKGGFKKVKHHAWKAKMLAATRMGGNTAMWAGPAVGGAFATKAAMEAVGKYWDEDDDDESNAIAAALSEAVTGKGRNRVDSAMPWWQRSSVNAVTDIDPENHTMTVMAIDYFSPTGGILNGWAKAIDRMHKESAAGNEEGVKAWFNVARRAIADTYFGEEVFMSSFAKRASNMHPEEDYENTGFLERMANGIDNWLVENLGATPSSNLAGAAAGAAIEQLPFPMIVSNAEDLAEYVNELVNKEESPTYRDRRAGEMVQMAIMHLAGLKQTVITPEKWARTAASDIDNYGQHTGNMKRALADDDINSFEEMREAVRANEGLRKYYFQTVHDSLHTASGMLGMPLDMMVSELDRENKLKGITGGTHPVQFWSGMYTPLSVKEVAQYFKGRITRDQYDADEASRRMEWYQLAVRELEPEQMTYGNE